MWLFFALFALAAVACGGAVAPELAQTPQDAGTFDPMDAVDVLGLAADAAEAASSGPVCDGVDGLATPPIPSAETPIPGCFTASTANRPYFTDAPVTQWFDPVNGDTRAACIFYPPVAHRTPLVVALHPLGGSADWVYDNSLLRAKAASTPFALISDQGRVLPVGPGYPPLTEHETFYRKSDAPDYRALDTLIDNAVATGRIDPTRIYLVGWSNGGTFAAEYGILRNTTPTPGGNRIAAAAIYSGADPYSNTSTTQDPTCAMTPPASSLPIYIIHRSCDARIACDTAQWTEFGLPPGKNVTSWVKTLRTSMGNANVRSVLIDSAGVAAAACMAATSCTPTIGDSNHQNWPDGINDGSGHDWEPELLGFLLKHKLL